MHRPEERRRATRLRLRTLGGLAIAGLALGLAGAPWAEEASPAAEPPVLSGSLLGGYLAGRIAQDEKDLDAASALFRQALISDPANEFLLRQAFLTEAEAGHWDRAALLADRVADVEGSYRLARIFLGAKAFKAGNWNEAMKQFSEAGVGPIGELTAALARAWVLTAQGDPKKGLETLDALKGLDWASFYRIAHRALIASLSGDKAVAEESFKELFDKNPKVMSVVLAYARYASSTGNQALAREIIERHKGEERTSHALVEADLETLRKGGTLPPYIVSPTEGLSEAFFGIAEALISEGGSDIGTIYLQLALYLTPDNPLILASLAGAQEQTRQYEDAIKTYARIPEGSPLHFTATLRRALNLSALERTDDAKQALLELLAVNPAPGQARPRVDTSQIETQVLALPNLQAKSRGGAVLQLQGFLRRGGYDAGIPDGVYGPGTVAAIKALQQANGIEMNGILGPQTRKALAARLSSIEQASVRDPSLDRRLQVLATLGNLLRGTKSFEEAARHYSEAISLVGPSPAPEHWAYFYSRAVCYERLKRWPEAEADFKKALELDGEQAVVLNYLGYSWVDQNMNLGPALEMIRKAVKLKPDDGYFVDSLGWAYFRLGQFPQAVTELERAVELKPDDPVINDHLGDAYWQAGRRLEARFQWSQALTLKPEPEEVPKIEAKLSSGLPAPAGVSPDAPVADANAAAGTGAVEAQ